MSGDGVRTATSSCMSISGGGESLLESDREDEDVEDSDAADDSSDPECLPSMDRQISSYSQLFTNFISLL